MMAAGGIVAFAEGGETADSPIGRRIENFRNSRVGQGLKRAGLMPNVDEEIKARKLRQALIEKYGASSGIPGAFKAQSDEERKKATDILNNLDSMSVAEMEQALSGAAPASAPKQNPLRAQEAAAGIPDGSVVPPVMSGTPDLPVTPDGLPVVPQMPAGPTGIAQVAGPTAATAAPVSMDYEGAATGMKAAGLFPQATKADFADEKAQKEVVAQEAIDRATAGRTREEDFQKKLGEYGVNKEKRLKEREADLSKDEKSNYGLAFLEAGLAMMGGESPNAFANISKGALQGMGSYKTGLAKLNERKEKLFDAYDALDDARRSDSKDKFARIEAANDKIDKATIALKQVGADIATKKGDFNRDQTRAFTTAVVQTANTEYTAKSQAAEGAANRATQVSVAESRQASERAIAQFSAASNRAIAEGQQATQKFIAQLPGDMQKLYTALGQGDPVAGLKLAKEVEATGKKDIMTLYTEWLKANPTLAMDPNKAMAAFFKQYSVMAGKIPQASDKPTGQARD